jgi:hypothetical protein
LVHLACTWLRCSMCQYAFKAVNRPSSRSRQGGRGSCARADASCRLMLCRCSRRASGSGSLRAPLPPLLAAGECRWRGGRWLGPGWRAGAPCPSPAASSAFCAAAREAVTRRFLGGGGASSASDPAAASSWPACWGCGCAGASGCHGSAGCTPAGETGACAPLISARSSANRSPDAAAMVCCRAAARKRMCCCSRVAAAAVVPASPLPPAGCEQAAAAAAARDGSSPCAECLEGGGFRGEGLGRSWYPGNSESAWGAGRRGEPPSCCARCAQPSAAEPPLAAAGAVCVGVGLLAWRLPRGTTVCGTRHGRSRG